MNFLRISLLTCLITNISAHVTAGVIEIKNEAEFQKIINSLKPTVVKFYAEWCGPCKKFAPIFEQASNSGELSSKVIFVAINIDRFNSLANKYSIRSLPSVLYFQNGTMKSKKGGTSNIGSFTAEIKSIFSL